MKNLHAKNMDDDLLIKYLTGDLSAEDAEAIRLAIEADPAKKEYLEQMEKIWKLSGGIKDFQRIDTTGDWDSLRGRFGFSQQAATPSLINKTRSLAFRMIRVAAMILLVFAAGFMIYYYTGSGALSRMDWTTLAAPDHMEEITLPDGSHVSLNAGSSLAYPAHFKGRKRTVRLDGEAFFEVAGNEDKAFIIHVSEVATAEVLGTSFNLRTDPDKKKVLLNVLTGKVAFFPKGKRRQAIVLSKDEHAEYHNGKIRQQVSLDLNFLSWKTRTLVFENTPLPQVMEQLGRHYHREFMIRDPGIDTLALTGTYQNQEIAEVLEEMALVLGIAFKETDGMILVTTSDAQTHEE
jgi:ferric-dicitrate binding protein FerR (iron transport regulator)